MVAASSEYSFTSAVKSSPVLAFVATSSARFLASSFVLFTVAGAFFAPLKTTSTCWAVIHSGFSAGLSGAAEGATVGVGAASEARVGGFGPGAAVDFAGVLAAGSSQPRARRNGAQTSKLRGRSMYFSSPGNAKGSSFCRCLSDAKGKQAVDLLNLQHKNEDLRREPWHDWSHVHPARKQRVVFAATF